MIANGTRVLFTARDGYGGIVEPHSGQVGTATYDKGDGYTIAFPDGQITWANEDEVTAL